MSSLDLAPTGEQQTTPSPARGQSEVVSVIRHTVIPGKEPEYEAWLHQIVPIASKAEGHRGVNVIRPQTGSRTYTIVLHFDALPHLEKWLASDIRKRLILDVQHLLEDGDQVEIKTGLEFWFTPPDSEQKRAKPYKQFLITLSAIFPLTILLPWLLRPLFHAAPILGMPGISNFVIAVGIVALMIYVIMPRYTRLMARWLYRRELSMSACRDQRLPAEHEDRGAGLCLDYSLLDKAGVSIGVARTVIVQGRVDRENRCNLGNQHLRPRVRPQSAGHRHHSVELTVSCGRLRQL